MISEKLLYMIHNQLKCSADGKRIALIIGDDERKRIFTTREPAIKEIIHCFCRQKISKEQRIEYINKVNALSLRTEKREEIGALSFIDQHTRHVAENNVLLCEPRFELCACIMSMSHGYIVDRNGIMLDVPIFSQEFGERITTLLYEKRIISMEQKSSLRKAFKNSELEKINPLYLKRN